MSLPPATCALLDLLENRFALRVLWALRDGHAQTFRLLQDSVGGITPSTLNARLKSLRAGGLVDHGEGGYHLTSLGQDLLRRLQDLPGFASQWLAQQARDRPGSARPPNPAALSAPAGRGRH